MKTLQHKLDAYKEAIQSKFDDEKNKEFSTYLMKPSRANLRNLCLERMKNNQNREDLNSFNLFLGFEFSLSQLNKLKAQKDKFRPIENFFKRESDLSDLEAINMAAIIVDFIPRPFRRFSEQYNETESEPEFGNNSTEQTQAQIQKTALKTAEVVSASKIEFEDKASLKKKVGYGFMGFLSLFGGSYIAKDLLFPEKQCMEWIKNRYELVDCIKEAQGIGSYEIIKPYEEKEFMRRELTVCDTTEFFVDGNSERPKVWYDKEDGIIFYFNMPGVNPETGDQLKPITDYMIGKYVKPCK